MSEGPLKTLAEDVGVLTDVVHSVLQDLRTRYVGPGTVCFWYDAAANTWVDVVFHQWCSTTLPPMAIVHSLEDGKCFLAAIKDLRFAVDHDED